MLNFSTYRNAVRIKAALNMWHSKLSAWSKHISIISYSLFIFDRLFVFASRFSSSFRFRPDFPLDSILRDLFVLFFKLTTFTPILVISIHAALKPKSRNIEKHVLVPHLFPKTQITFLKTMNKSNYLKD
ncbi:hypothetical protein BpHYR1_025782 [Brachionus plicatilis]|uniref:Uncharacterized protein n=1 Tax=Brachionus plicatilis TaxID=10195 RepID=A0A3M7R664_BRAPC|nr:hypothetical protein BpHYR1_025782 [Brachionus plicatilis]